MNAPLFLSVDDIHFLHGLSIERFRGTLGVRDAGGLESAVHHPRNVHFYGGDLFDVAAAYAFHISEGQCFLDGNKRTAVSPSLNFLYANEVKPRIVDLELYDLMIKIAEKKATKQDLAEYLRAASPGV